MNRTVDHIFQLKLAKPCKKQQTPPQKEMFLETRTYTFLMGGDILYVIIQLSLCRYFGVTHMHSSLHDCLLD